jgi:D-xylose transport system substrate-binding protein
MTVYKAIKPEAYAAADLAYALIKGEHPKNDRHRQQRQRRRPLQASDPGRGDQGQHHGHRRHGFHKVSDICAGTYAAACAKEGIK